MTHPREINQIITPEKAKRWDYALADVIQWMNGFQTAIRMTSTEIDLPPGFSCLQEIKAALRDARDNLDESGEVDHDDPIF